MDTLIFKISRSVGIMKNAENNLEEQWRAAGRRCARLPWNNLKNICLCICLFLCLCLCLRICHCHCLCICVTLPSLNSSCHELSENVWVWGRGTVRCAAFNLFVFVTVFVFVIVFVIVIVIVLVSRCRLWIALVTSFQKMYGFGGVGLSEVQNSISELSVVGGWWVGGWVDGTNALHGRTFTGSDKKVCIVLLAR